MVDGMEVSEREKEKKWIVRHVCTCTTVGSESVAAFRLGSDWPNEMKGSLTENPDPGSLFAAATREGHTEDREGRVEMHAY